MALSLSLLSLALAARSSSCRSCHCLYRCAKRGESNQSMQHWPPNLGLHVQTHTYVHLCCSASLRFLGDSVLPLGPPPVAAWAFRGRPCTLILATFLHANTMALLMLPQLMSICAWLREAQQPLQKCGKCIDCTLARAIASFATGRCRLT